MRERVIESVRERERERERLTGPDRQVKEFYSSNSSFTVRTSVMAWLGFASRAQDVWVTVKNRHKTNLGTVFTTLHFLHNLLMGTRSYSVT